MASTAKCRSPEMQSVGQVSVFSTCSTSKSSRVALVYKLGKVDI